MNLRVGMVGPRVVIGNPIVTRIAWPIPAHAHVCCMRVGVGTARAVRRQNVASRILGTRHHPTRIEDIMTGPNDTTSTISTTGSTGSTGTAGAGRYVPYSPGVEQIEDGEQKIIDEIIETMSKESQTTEERYGQAVRTSHAKSIGLLKGELTVLDGLPPELRQGLFGAARSCPVITRLAVVPGELLDDRKVSSPRGMAVKVLGVQGERLPGHEGEATQDFVFDTGPVFPSPGPKGFLATIKTIGMATPAPDIVKEAVSLASRATNAVFHAVGSDSPNLDFFGHPPYMPLAESYYSQSPFRYGDYIAKFRIAPASPDLLALVGEKLDIQAENGVRDAVSEHIRMHGAEYEVAVQLCTDLGAMPVENAHAEWSEDDSPYIPVARLHFPPQDGWSQARSRYVDERLSFSPAHTLAAHRPLGGLNRARLQAYDVMSALRRNRNGQPLTEPASVDEMPD